MAGMTPKRRERAAKALGLRKQGMTYQAIADELGISYKRAHDDVNDSLREITREPSEQLLTLELERLDQMLVEMNLEGQKVSREVKNGGMSVAQGVSARSRINEQKLKILDRRSKYLGMDQFKAEVKMDGADAIREALGTIVSTPDEDLLAMIEGDAPDTEV